MERYKKEYLEREQILYKGKKENIDCVKNPILRESRSVLAVVDI